LDNAVTDALSGVNFNRFKSWLEGEPEEDEKLNEKPEDTSIFTNQPTEAQTGVPAHIARVAASLSNQIYHIKGDFKLSTKDHQATIIIKDDKGKFKYTNPVFVAVVCDKTMILGWRGSTHPTDFLNDAAASPCLNMALGAHAKNIKLQGAMASLMQNDIINHQDKIIEECKNRGITNIVTTGHSLGGALAQIGHTMIRAQMQDKRSPWYELKDLGIRSLAFSGLMSTQIVSDGLSDETEEFIKELDENSCNVVYYNDGAPRMYALTSFLIPFVEDVDLGSTVSEKVPYGTQTFVKMIVGHLDRAATTSVFATDDAEEMFNVWAEYIHPGRIVFYENSDAVPKTLKDYGPNYDGKQTDAFRAVNYDPTGPTVAQIKAWHSRPYYGMGIPDQELI
jgi:hypothetical protein